MRWPVTLLGAIAGLALASIPGALLGGVLGHSLDRRLQIRSWKGLLQRLGWNWGELADNDLLFILLGRLAKCDGRVLESHIAQTRAEMRRLKLGTDQQRKAIQAFNRGKSGEDGLLLPLRRLRKRPEQVRDMLAACWRLAATENPTSERKRNRILRWGRRAGRSPGAAPRAPGSRVPPWRCAGAAPTRRPWNCWVWGKPRSLARSSGPIGACSASITPTSWPVPVPVPRKCAWRPTRLASCTAPTT